MVDHSYHEKTKSSEFLPALLRKHRHTVDIFLDEQWNRGKGVRFDTLLKYDAIIMFQTACLPVQYYRLKHKNVIFVPMLDSYGSFNKPIQNHAKSWEPFQGSKIVSFSQAVHYIATAFGLFSFPIQYYPPLSDTPVSSRGLHGFFWIRHEQHVSWPLVRELIKYTKFDSLHIHVAPDPASPDPTLPSPDECSHYSISISHWFPEKKDFLDTLGRANVFFASRCAEGIGMSFLEAMARGQCVVAPNHATMNEYILHGVNGLLYNPMHPTPLDFSQAQTLGEQAYNSVKSGVLSWSENEKQLVDFILTPAPNLYADCYKHPGLSHPWVSPLAAQQLRNKLREWPLVRFGKKLWNNKKTIS